MRDTDVGRASQAQQLEEEGFHGAAQRPARGESDGRALPRRVRGRRLAGGGRRGGKTIADAQIIDLGTSVKGELNDGAFPPA
jgi:hypothetical protein